MPNLPAIHDELLVADLDGQYAGVRDPITGEVIPLSDTAKLADWLVSLRAHEDAITRARRIVSQLIIAAMDKGGSWTINRPGGSVRAPSPAPGMSAAQWDGNELYTVLSRLVDEDVITAEARDNAVEIKTEYKAKAKGVAALLKIPVVAPYVESCRAEEPPPKPRSVSVK